MQTTSGPGEELRHATDNGGIRLVLDLKNKSLVLPIGIEDVLNVAKQVEIHSIEIGDVQFLVSKEGRFLIDAPIGVEIPGTPVSIANTLGKLYILADDMIEHVLDKFMNIGDTKTLAEINTLFENRVFSDKNPFDFIRDEMILERGNPNFLINGNNLTKIQ